MSALAFQPLPSEAVSGWPCLVLTLQEQVGSPPVRLQRQFGLLFRAPAAATRRRWPGLRPRRETRPARGSSASGSGCCV